MREDELLWEVSDPYRVDFNWQSYESVIPVDDQKELVSIKVKHVNIGERAIYLDNLSAQKNLLNDKLYGPQIVHMPYEGASKHENASVIVFGAHVDVRIVNVQYVAEKGIIGDDSDSMQLRIVNSTSHKLLSTKTFVAGVNSVPGIVFDFGPVNDESAFVPANDSLKLEKINVGGGKALPKGLLLIQWDYA